MLDLWSYRAGLKEQVGAIEKELDSSRAPGAPAVKLAIHAEIGAGRHSIVRALSSRMDLAIVELPAFEDLDAPLHGLVQLASQAGALDTVLRAPGADRLKLTELAAQALADAGRAVAVLLPAPRAGSPGETDAATRAQIEQMLAVLVNVPALRVAVLAPPGTRLRADFTRQMALAAPKLGAQQIQAAALPGDFGAAASALAAWMAKHDWASTPIEARLQIGLIALGHRPDEVALRLEALARKLIPQLRRRPPLAAAVHRMLLARRALPLEEVARVSGVEPRWQPLLTSCIGYGDDLVRVPEITRQVLLDALKASPEALEDAHGALARYHESLDGARSLQSLGQDQAMNWLEKVHHLALGGPACADAWSAQEPAGREQLWERARYLSRDRYHFHAAAAIYRQCIDRFGPDPYSQHYLAYNLERAHGELEEIRVGYRHAAGEEPDNPWWQQRWIRFLIAHGTLAEAREAWRSAIRKIDPDGTRLRRSAWLAQNLHYWVARRWLALGRLEEAREVLSEIPARWLEQEAELRDLEQRLAAQEQALHLGASVYPTSTPLAERWQRPRGLRPARAGRRLISWAPGRVVEASPTGVTVVVAPTPDDAQQVSFDAATWERMSGEPAGDADGFFELGTYEGDAQVVRLIPDDDAHDPLDAEEADLLARVAAWAP